MVTQMYAKKAKHEPAPPSAPLGMDLTQDFPRGGGDRLTPSEHRAIRREVDRELLFPEHKTDQPKAKSAFDEMDVDQGSDGEGEGEADEEEALSSRPGKRLTQVFELNPHRVKVGQSFLGYVENTNARGISVSLPDGMQGFVDAESATAGIAHRLGEGFVNLAQLFPVGTAVRCVVIEIDRTDSRLRIKLSLRPDLTNAQLELPSIASKSLVWGEIASLEDKGYAVDIGVEGVTAFLAFTEVPSNLEYQVGQPMFFFIAKLSRPSANVLRIQLTTQSNKITHTKFRPTENTSLTDLQAGWLLPVTVQSVVPGGLVLQLGGFFVGTSPVATVHVSQYKEGQELLARIVWIDYDSKKVMLGVSKHVVLLTVPDFAGITVGQQITAPVQAVLKKGLLVKLHSRPLVEGFIGNKNLDANEEDIERDFSPGTEVDCRVARLNWFSGVLTCTAKASALQEYFFTAADALPGLVTKVKVVQVQEKGVIVSLSPTVTGFIPSIHFGDKPSAKLATQFTVGKTVQARVVSHNPAKRSVVLTAKKLFLQPDAPLLVNFEDAQVGMLSYGWVSKVRPDGLLISFLNNLVGFAHISQVGGSKVPTSEQLAKAFHVGSTVSAIVTSVEPAKHRLSLTLDLNFLQQAAAANMYPVGSWVSAVVQEVTEDGLHCVIEGEQPVAAVVPSFHVSDHAELTPQLLSLYQAGQVIQAMVLEPATRAGVHLVLTLKKTLTAAIEKSLCPAAIEACEVGSVYVGFVRNITSYGCFIGFQGSVTALAAKSSIADHFVQSPDQDYELGQTVFCAVTGRSEVNGSLRVSLSLKASDVRRKATTEDSQLGLRYLESIYLSSFFDEKRVLGENRAAEDPTLSIQPGQQVKCKIDSLKDFGILSNYKGVTCITLSRHSQDIAAQPGDELPGTVLDVDPASGLLDVSFWPDLSAAQQVDKATSKALKDLADRHSVVEVTVLLAKSGFAVVSIPVKKKLVIGAALTHLIPAVNHKLTIGDKAEAQLLPLGSSRVLVVFTGEMAKRKPAGAAAGDLQPGQKVSAKVIAVHRPYITLAIKTTDLAGVKGRVHITQILDEDEEDDLPTQRYKVGQMVEAKILSLDFMGTTKQLAISNAEGNKTQMLELSLRPSALATCPEPEPALDWTNLKKGQKIIGFVHQTSEHGLWIHVAANIRGRCFLLDCSEDPEVLERLAASFPEGRRVRCEVLAVDREKHVLDLTLVKRRSFSKNSVLLGRVSKVSKMGLRLQLSAHHYGFAFLTDITDQPTRHPTKGFELGQLVKCCITEVVQKDGNEERHLSLRESRLTGSVPEGGVREITAISDLSVGEQHVAFVAAAHAKNGIYVWLSRTVQARILPREIQDSYVTTEDIAAKYTKGKGVKGVIYKIEDDRAEMSLKPSRLHPENSFDGLAVGSIIKGHIKKIADFGLFIGVDRSGLTALAHRSQLFDGDAPENLNQAFTIGDPVKAVIAKKDEEHKRISLCLKPSELKKARKNSKTEKKEKKDKKQDKKGKKKEKESSGEEEEEEEEQEKPRGRVLVPIDDDQSDSDDEVLKQLRAEMAEPEDEEGEGDSDEDSDSSDEDNSSSSSSSASSSSSSSESDSDEGEDDGQSSKRLKLDAGEFNWGLQQPSDDEEEEEEKPKKKSKKEKKSKRKAVDADGEIEFSDKLLKQSEKDAKKKHKEESKKAKKEKKEQVEDGDSESEEEVRQREQYLAGFHEPTSVEEFERLVLAQPNSAFVWVKFMAFWMEMNNIGKARDTAARALETIGYHEQEEKFNVWTALLNMEHAYGTEESLASTFQRACQFCDLKKIHFALLNIYTGAKKTQQADTLYQAMLRKFRQSAGVWTHYGRFLIEQHKSDASRKLLERALKTLPRDKHLKVISKFAQLEFKHGVVERGRTMFEGILTNYPKRVDLWNVWLDLETRQAKLSGNLAPARSLFDRVITLKFSPKKMKFFFKKYRDFETEYGSPEQAEQVKQKAIAYVQAALDQ